MQELYGLSNYYLPKINNRNLREDLLQGRINANKNNYEIVYGESHGPWLQYSNMYAYSGYTVNGDDVSTEKAPWYAGWSGTQIQNFNMISEPWVNTRVKGSYGIQPNEFDNYTNPYNKYLSNANGTFEQAIITGLNQEYGNRKYSEFMYNHMNEGYATEDVYRADSSPSKGGKWVDYVHVLQPPTYLSWGSGRIYILGSSGNITYLGIPIAPFILQEDDLSVHFESLPSGAVKDDQVRVAIKLNSTFVDDKTTDYTWEIKTSSGSPVAAVFSGHASAGTGNITIPSNGDRILYADFTMPASKVNIKFSLNSGKSPGEASYANNQLNSGTSAIKLVNALPTKTREYDLDYNVLAKKAVFDLSDGASIMASLSLPADSKWDENGNATGSLNVKNNTTDLLRWFSVAKNPLVDEPGTNIVRQPEITTSLQRTDFGDDPINSDWLNKSSPQTPLTRSGNITFAGSVKRDYIHTYQVCSSTNQCKNVSERGSTSAPFTPGKDIVTVNAYIYNGQETVPAKSYDDKIESNTADSLHKNLLWTSEPYLYKTIRWMAQEDEKGTLHDWTAVKGQYQRTFTQQASGDLLWVNQRTMAQEYKKGRDAARSMTNNKSLYDKAVFATDRELQKYSYPIKSGYYFNPTGVYDFTIETVTYKPTEDDTKDHKDLVDAVIDSFRYETDLMYVNNNKIAVNLLNEPLAKQGNSFVRKPAALSANNKKGVNAATLLTIKDRSTDASRYTKEVEEIYHSQDTDEDSTHNYWKNILEGYSQSGTLSSFNQFKYREYVGSNQHMYKITEKTTVSFVINKDNLSLYTDARMPDGKYYVKAWIADVELGSSANAYKTLGKLVGIKPLDQIEVNVTGSMYDDLNN